MQILTKVKYYQSLLSFLPGICLFNQPSSLAQTSPQSPSSSSSSRSGGDNGADPEQPDVVEEAGGAGDHQGR